ncbi:MAG: 2-keto-4-pentenoate hydratase [Polaromonas sp.]|uniref:2-keto-4-pentenoate hydratase n=1 Tax=Polaromonas sp. TaxID=1869339 RepID=UPI004036282A
MTIPTEGLAADISGARLQARALAWPAGVPADLPAGYAAALAVRAARIAAGEGPAGYKVGFTNRTIWPRYQVYAPIWGTVWQGSLSQVDAAGPNAGVLSLAGLCEPRIEPEIVFGLRAAPVPGCTLAQLADAVAWVAHGFEIVHTHFPGWKFSAAQAVADEGLHGRLLVGQRVELPPGAAPQALAEALSGIRLRLYGDGVLKDQGTGAHVLDGPLQALLHFVNELRALPGAPLLQAGDLVTTGTLTDAWPVSPGQTWHTELQGSGPLADQLSGLSVRFEQ